jgi:ribosomal protein S26
MENAACVPCHERSPRGDLISRLSLRDKLSQAHSTCITWSKKTVIFKYLLPVLFRNLFVLTSAILVVCHVRAAEMRGTASCVSEIVVSVADQELAFVARGKVVKRFPVSTSKFGTGDAIGSYSDATRCNIR